MANMVIPNRRRDSKDTISGIKGEDFQSGTPSPEWRSLCRARQRPPGATRCQIFGTARSQL